MTKSLKCFLVLACSLLWLLCAPATVAACDTMKGANESSTCVVMPHKGNTGVWFGLLEANNLRKIKLEVPELKLQIQKQERLEKKSDKELALLRDSLQLRKDVISGLKSSIGVHVKDASQARKEAARDRAELDRWYRSPIFLMAVGAVVTGGLMGFGYLLFSADSADLATAQ